MKHLFISHAWNYSDDYNRFLGLVNSLPYFQYKNYSVPISSPFERMSRKNLEDAIWGQIRPASVVVILGGMYVSHSDWIQYEIDLAEHMGKPILGVLPRGQLRMPAAMRMKATRIVGWNSNSIVTAIQELTS